MDAAPGGLGDWLADIVTGTLPGPEPETHTAKPDETPIRPESIREDGSISSNDGAQAESDTDPFVEKKEDNEADASEQREVEEEEKPPPSAQKTPKPKRPSMGLKRESTYSKPTYPEAPQDVSQTDLEPYVTLPPNPATMNITQPEDLLPDTITAPNPPPSKNQQSLTLLADHQHPTPVAPSTR